MERFRLDAAMVYREAEETARANLSRYLETFRDKDEAMRQRVADGGMTEDAYQLWRRMQMLTGRRYRAMLDQVAAGYTDANEWAMSMLRERLGDVAAENCDYATWQVEDAAKVDTTYALQDASTIDEMLRDADTYLPRPSVKSAKDQAWNRRQVASQVTQGVLLGEGIPKIAARIRNVTNSTAAAATRAARTSVTAAECAGRVAGYHRAREMGIDLRQEWMATLDGRTRHSHRQMDGERVEVGEEFSNGCRYPGDPEAPYAETMNCRCTLVAVVDGIDPMAADRFSRLPEGMTYEQWRESRPARVGAAPANRTIAEFMEMPGTARKLDAAGVSKTEARRLLTEQLREYGIPSGSFRKMSAGDQQSVLDGALGGVRERAGKTARRKHKPIERSFMYSVNMERVKSPEYAALVSKAVGKDAAAGTLDAIKHALKHRGGTSGEDLYAIDLATGKTITSCVNSDIGSAVMPPAKFGKKVGAAVADGRRVALLHNHPASGIPSAADLRGISSRGCEMGVIAAHDGSIYTFRKVGEPTAIYNLTQEWVDYIAKSYGNDETRMLRAFREKLGFEIEHIA